MRNNKIFSLTFISELSIFNPLNFTCKFFLRDPNSANMPSNDTTMELHGEQERTRDIRTRLENLPHAFPQTANYPVSWKVIYTLVYDCLRQLGLVNTLDLFMAESNAMRARPLMEEGWFLKSFVLNESFHSMLIYLLEQFNQAEPRLKCLAQTVIPNSNSAASNESAAVCQAQDQVTESVREQVRVDSVLMSETQQQIKEQMLSTDCRVRGTQADQESECRREAQQESVQQEQQQKDDQQEDGNFTDVCNRSRARIMDNFRASLDNDSMRQSLRQRAQRNFQRQLATDQGPACSTPQKQDGGEFADVCSRSRAKIMDTFRASLDNDSIKQQNDCKQQIPTASCNNYSSTAQPGQEEQAQQFVDSVMSRSRGRIMENLRQSFDNDSVVTNRRNLEQLNLRKQIALRNLAMDGERVEWRCGGKTRPKHQHHDKQVQGQPQQQQNCVAWQQHRQSSLPAENNLCGDCVDPRRNQSFRVMQQNQHSGWRMQPLGPMGPFRSNNDSDRSIQAEDILQQPTDGAAGYAEQCEQQPEENWENEGNVLVEQGGQNPGIFLQAPRCERKLARRRKKRVSDGSQGMNSNCSHCLRRSDAWKAAKDAANATGVSGTHFSRWSQDKMPRGESRRLSVASGSSRRGSSAGSDSCNRPPWRL